mgnify:CR=1 FL=1
MAAKSKKGKKVPKASRMVKDLNNVANIVGGLGLSIVKHLVVAHGGDVGIESEVGRGTRVWLVLPTSPDPETRAAGG